MVKTPRTRHSKTKKNPLTIDLEASKSDEQKPQRSDSAEEEARGDKGVAPAASPASTKPAMKPEAGGEAAGGGKERKTETAGRQKPETSPKQPETSETEAADTSVSGPRQPPRGRGSAAGLVAAAVIGGLIVLAVGAALTWSGLLTPENGDDATQAAIEQLRDEFTALQSDIERRLGEANAAADEASKRIGEIESLAGNLRENGERFSTDLDAVRSQVESLRSAVEQGGAGDGAALQALGDRLGELEQRVKDLQNSGAGGEAEFAQLQQRLLQVERDTETARGAAESAMSTSSANATAIETVRQEVEALQSRLDAERPEVALAIAAAALKSAIDRGAPFMVELETYAAIAPDAPEIAALREMAAEGVPTRSQISREVSDVANAVAAAGEVSDPDAGFFERLIESAQSLITVRPIGMVAGESPAAIAARMEAAIIDNDYARAIAEFESLPENIKPVAEHFIARVRARKQADELVDQALSNALRPAG